jgi:hypothetical protein
VHLYGGWHDGYEGIRALVEYSLHVRKSLSGLALSVMPGIESRNGDVAAPLIFRAYYRWILRCGLALTAGAGAGPLFRIRDGHGKDNLAAAIVNLEIGYGF